MKKLNRTTAVAGTVAVLAALGLGSAVTAAQAADTKPAAPSVQTSDGDGEAKDATEAPEKEAQEAEDGPNQGPDANPNEPGHQDADESGETK